MLAVRYYLLISAVFLQPIIVHASSQFFIFGGGPTPNESQASIEQNTRWIKDIIQRQHPDSQLHLHYTDGNEVNLDVRTWSPVKSSRGQLQALARVFNFGKENGYFYSSSNLAENVKPSDSKSIAAALNALIGNSQPGDELLLIYQGHGGYQSDTNKNHFRLWNGTHINVTDFEAIMSKANPEATIRFLFPQCFSGAFSRLIYNGAQVEEGIAKGRRCGFVAQREDRESEGCTDSINTSDYRDYSSYFFSALDGKGIDGSPLLNNPDRNNDGVITLLEAHYYSLKNAFSVDFSRSTSQDYLEKWQPWYLRWLPIPHESEVDNAYSEIADYIANRFKLDGEGNKVISEVSKRMGLLMDKIDGLKKEQNTLEKKIKKMQKHIQNKLAKRWPAIVFPYTQGFREIMLESVEEIEASILSYPGYQKLLASQKRSTNIEKELLDSEREFVQMKKILWMRKLARIYDQFQRYASDHEKQEYEKLVQCEDAPL